MTQPFLLFLDVGGGELLLILLAAFLLLGPKKIPDIARRIGKGMNELNKIKQGLHGEFENAKDDIEKDLEIDENPEDKQEPTKDADDKINKQKP